MIKKITTAVLTIVLLLVTKLTTAQVVESNFEMLTVPSVGYWNGSSNPDMNTGFYNGSCYFNCYYNSNFGGYWEKGFAYSNTVDTTTQSFLNLYGCAAGKGYAGSNNYIMAQQNSVVNLIPINAPHTKNVEGFYVTNSYYSYSSMKFGDSFDTPFGDSTGNRPDFFRLVIRGYLNGTFKNDSVVFYLADFRFINNSQDYIIKDWTWVNCQSLGNVDSVNFRMESSRVGQFGINTPLFFAIDNFTTNYYNTSSVAELSNYEVSVLPNPAKDHLRIESDNIQIASVKIFTIEGKQMLDSKLFSTAEPLDITALPAGIYFIEIQTDDALRTRKFIKD
jgi:hypothetical protein